MGFLTSPTKTVLPMQVKCRAKGVSPELAERPHGGALDGVVRDEWSTMLGGSHTQQQLLISMARKSQRAKKPRAKAARKSQNTRRALRAGYGYHPTLTECGAGYLNVMTRPFAEETTNEEQCVPATMAFPSKKRCLFHRGTLGISTTGYGFVTVKGKNPTSNGLAFLHSSNTSVGGNTTTFNAFTNPVTASWSDSEFVTGDFTNGKTMLRLVGLGLRVAYRGTEDKKSGMVYTMCRPTPGWNPVTKSCASVAAFRQAELSPVGRQWSQVTYYPLDSTDMDFGSETDTYHVVACIVGADPGSLFEYEVIGYYEYRGDLIDEMTESSSDPIGFGAILSAVAGRASPYAATAYRLARAEVMRRVAEYGRSLIGGRGGQALLMN